MDGGTVSNTAGETVTVGGRVGDGQRHETVGETVGGTVGTVRDSQRRQKGPKDHELHTTALLHTASNIQHPASHKARRSRPTVSHQRDKQY